MGESPWKTPYELWREKLGLNEPKKNNTAMQRGIDLEGQARDQFIEEMGIIVKPAVFKLEGTPFSCSLDGVSEDRKTIVEIKCPGKEDHDVALNGDIPRKYWAQLQHQMYVMDVQSAYYFSYTAYGFAIVEVKRDDEYIEHMIEEHYKFWDCVTSLESPELTDRDFEDRAADLTWQFWVAQWEQLQKDKRQIDDREELIRKKMIELSGGRNCRGAGLRMTQFTRRGAVDYVRIPELQNVDLEKYRKSPVTSWRFTAEK
jgi:putative phage-type endonuclease